LNKVVERTELRYQALSNAIGTSLEHCEFAAVQGGMFLWLQLPPGSDAMSIAASALQKEVAVVPGDVFFTDLKNRGAKTYLRLNFSNTEEHNFEIAILRLADAMAI
jgi:DNA-binding transcriptional MocR family regulator